MKTKIIASGKRKTAVAKAMIIPGKGEVTYNGKSLENVQMFHKLSLSEPVEIYKKVMDDMPYNITVRVSGGGKESQVQAGRLAIAKALLKISNSAELKKAFLSYDRAILVADTRRKEPYKPGDSKARARRQTSYR